MGEDTVQFLLKEVRELRRADAEQHLEVMTTLAEMEKDREHFWQRLGEVQEEVASLMTFRNDCLLRTAENRGRIAAYMGAGAFLAFVMDRLRLWDALAAMFR